MVRACGGENPLQNCSRPFHVTLKDFSDDPSRDLRLLRCGTVRFALFLPLSCVVMGARVPRVISPDVAVWIAVQVEQPGLRAHRLEANVLRTAGVCTAVVLRLGAWVAGLSIGGCGCRGRGTRPSSASVSPPVHVCHFKHVF
jgi:hypothetical protein